MATRTDAGNGHRRRQVIARVKAEETDCWLCGEPVDKTLTMAWGEHSKRCTNPECAGCVPHPMRAEVDEVTPRSKGGDPLDRNNCRLSHRICNQRKGNRDGLKPVVARTDFPVTRAW